MRAPLPIVSQIDYCDHYENISQNGGGDVFRGRQMQHGAGFGSFLRAIARKAVPLLKKAAPHILRAGVNIASNVIGGEDVGTAVKTHGVNAIKSFASDVINNGKAKHVPVRKGHKRKNRSESDKPTKKKKSRVGGFLNNLFEAY
jgi:hypothetical protein